MKYPSKYFGEIDDENLAEWYETTTQLHNREIDISMTFLSEKRIVDNDIFEKIDLYIDNLVENEQEIYSLLKEDYNQEGVTKEYIDIQTKYLESDDISMLIKNADSKLSKEEKLLSMVKLLQIVFYPDKEDNMFAVYDYTIDEELTDDLLVAKLYKDDGVTVTLKS